MPKIIKLGELLPEDFVVDLNGKKFTLPGDPPLELIIKVGELFERSNDAGDNGKAEEIGLEVLQELDAEMLKLLRMRDDTITQSPFGVIGVQHVVAALLQAYNFGEAEEPLEEDEENPPPASRSKRSSGSQSSSTSSSSRRTTGGRSAGRSSKPGSA